MTQREPRRRAVTPEWAAQTTDRLYAIERKIDRLLTFHGIDHGQRPDTVTHTEQGLFAPGSGIIPNHELEVELDEDDRPVHYEPRASAEFAENALEEARRALRRHNELVVEQRAVEETQRRRRRDTDTDR